MPSVNSVSSNERNYQKMIENKDDTTTEGKSKTEKVYDMVVDNKKESEVGFKDLFSLMINQLTNQDFMNPTDDSQYLAQMTQIAGMSATQNLAKYLQAQYLTGFLGKEVTVSSYSVGGGITTETGTVSQITWDSNNENYKFVVNEKKFDMSDLTNISIPSSETDEKTETDKADEETKAEILKLIQSNNNSIDAMLSAVMGDNTSNTNNMLDMMRANNSIIQSLINKMYPEEDNTGNTGDTDNPTAETGNTEPTPDNPTAETGNSEPTPDNPANETPNT
ncbi:MAG: hypothetical protein LBM93_14250 [Oscillospiraceae bacterium]|jgi:flagellar basal-body rod modification protein FlgD|nr:hypothetical protein [Oscillospiraceae bacterium]